jgi:hypothetical protein
MKEWSQYALNLYLSALIDKPILHMYCYYKIEQVEL